MARRSSAVIPAGWAFPNIDVGECVVPTDTVLADILLDQVGGHLVWRMTDDGDVRSDALHVLRSRCPAHMFVVGRAAVARVDHDWLTEPRTQIFQHLDQLVGRQHLFMWLDPLGTGLAFAGKLRFCEVLAQPAVSHLGGCDGGPAG